MLGLIRKIVVMCAVLAAAAFAAPWRAIGPDGGDARSLAGDPANPDHILLGTSSSQLFVSHDGGYTWSRLARVGDGDHYVVDHIVFDPAHPQTIYAAAWSVETDGGDIFRSDDAGQTWRALPAMHGKSVRSFAVAASDSRLLVAGALDGIFRSRDGGESWERISPPGHPEIKNIESVAIDPKDPDVIYAGTWHLPWKTTDGGRMWYSIKDGVVDDSDVFSIILDPRDSRIVYASACTGIYKSEDAGGRFRKVQGIPYSSRRTRVLRQHPIDPNMVYAGTTEGLWVSINAGQAWHRVTSETVIVNDMLVDPRHPGTVLLATDRGGILRSENGGATFFASNRGFAHRQVNAVLVDRNDPNLIYAGVINDKEYGGLFVSRDAGDHWEQMNDGLAGLDIFTLRQSEAGVLVAGTNRGVYARSPGEGAWHAMNQLARENEANVFRVAPVTKASNRPSRPKAGVLGTPASKRERPKPSRPEMSGRVSDVELAGETWYAATAEGLFTSTDTAHSWKSVAGLAEQNFLAIRAAGNLVVAITPGALLVSHNGGKSWQESALPRLVTPLSGAAIGPDGSLWFSSRGGAYSSTDGGESWQHAIIGIDAVDVTSILYDSDNRRLMATSVTGAFESTDLGRTWRRSGERTSRLRGIALGGGRIYARTDYDGVIAQKDRILLESSSGMGGGRANQ